ncbi:hypothetical protein [Corynebacterium sp. UMB2355A]|uniref:hypothetical protein n=1 Tax=Corynebacterium sp. UMB2355A TaxID=3081222 RepID=UPI0029FF1EFF|nr:hypothetical protein [Corynebacterium sp. UMB2355A]WPJ93683.1 hypothetical protein R0V12_04890 [Corynebacterium sp. UMB2355A]
MKLPIQFQAPSIFAAVLAVVSIVVAVVMGETNSKAPVVQPRGEQSVIQVVTEDGKSAGVCSLGGLRQEKVHYTDKNSVYYWKLEPGEERINASCPSVAALSSGRVDLEGHATVSDFDKPQVVKITVR